MYSKLQYISQGQNEREQIQNIQRVLDGGCTWIQLRFKNASDAELMSTAERIKQLCTTYKATLIVNDRTEVAKHVDADGVHLGLTDQSIEEARISLGKTKIIGGTANTVHDVLKRLTEPCDYIGLGPFRFTSTKEKLSPVLGASGYHAILSQLVHAPRLVPIYAIGGIGPDDVEDIIQIGVYGVAVSGVLTKATDTKGVITQFNQKLTSYVATGR